ncbi:hypothetical protein CK203_102653 [Vitis vinifera]|uniref:Uncharacterized protein n=1 Tax=Vitis vinifera TaxID=29760 RepID=A0A438C5Y6_VITVI|nr:hypothetical protein CK203_102653 [Vitis vinifera]
MCGGDFMSKNPEEAMDFLSYVSEVSRGWDEPNNKEMGKRPVQQMSRGGMYNLSEDMEMKPSQPNSEDFSSDDERLGSLSLRAKVINFVDYSLNQGAPVGHESTETPIGHESAWKPRPNPYQSPAQSTPTESRLTNWNTVNEKGKLPSQPHQNPKGYMKWNPKMRILQRSTCLLHSSSLAWEETDQDASEILDVLRQVKQAFLAEQVSAIIQCKSPIKYKDPWCPTISVNIGGTQVEKALLDLGASVNLLPYSYTRSWVGELKPTSITLSLADRSVKIPRRVIEDVLVQVDKFYYPVDFVVLDTDPIVKGINYVSIILGKPFLATSNQSSIVGMGSCNSLLGI